MSLGSWSAFRDSECGKRRRMGWCRKARHLEPWMKPGGMACPPPTLPECLAGRGVDHNSSRSVFGLADDLEVILVRSGIGVGVRRRHSGRDRSVTLVYSTAAGARPLGRPLSAPAFFRQAGGSHLSRMHKPMEPGQERESAPHPWSL